MVKNASARTGGSPQPAVAFLLGRSFFYDKNDALSPQARQFPVFGFRISCGYLSLRPLILHCRYNSDRKNRSSFVRNLSADNINWNSRNSISHHQQRERKDWRGGGRDKQDHAGKLGHNNF